MVRRVKVAVIIPAYNESIKIGTVVKGLTKILSHQEFGFEIIVVDDGSKDQTAKRAKAAGAKVIRHVLNMGTGCATTTGLSYAAQNGFSIAVTADGDGQHHPSDVLKGIKLIMKSDADLLIGSRFIKANKMSRVKIIGNRGLSFITYLLFGTRVTDSQSGLRIFSKTALDQLKWKTSGFEFCSEMLWRASQLHLRIKEYPIKTIYTDYSMSKGQNNWNAINIIKTLVERRFMELFGE